jgi:hypothetical protein
VGGSNGDGAWRGLVTIAELIDPRPYKIDLPISEVDLHCNLYERPCINSSRSKSPYLTPQPELRRVCAALAGGGAPGGAIVLYCRTTTGFVYTTRSDDLGRTWTEPGPVLALKVGPGR